jgi:hypothetical protein
MGGSRNGFSGTFFELLRTRIGGGTFVDIIGRAIAVASS